MVLEKYEPVEQYDECKNKIIKINQTTKVLYIKGSDTIFQRNKFHKQIKELTIAFNSPETKPVKEFRTPQIINNINSSLGWKAICDKIYNVTYFLLFKMINGK